MILDLLQYLQNKDHQHHKGLQQVTEIIFRLSGCAGQAADAVSAYTQVETEDAPKLLKISKSECPDIWIRQHDTNGPNHGPVWKTLSFFLSEICIVILWQDCYGKGNLRTSYWNPVGRRFPNVNAYSYTVKRVILICVCGWQQIGWKETQNFPIWKVLNKEVDLGEPTSFLDTKTWAALKDNVK